MRVLALIALPATLLIGGCDAYGGADGDGASGPATFVVAARSPDSLSGTVPVTAYVEVTFSDLIDTATVDADAILLNGEAYGDRHVDGKKLRFTPWGLTPGTFYTVSLDPELTGKNGHPLGAYADWTFKTAGTPPDDHPPLGPRPR